MGVTEKELNARPTITMVNGMRWRNKGDIGKNEKG